MDLYKANITTAGMHAGEIYDDVDPNREPFKGLIAAGYLAKVTAKEAKALGVEPQSLPEPDASSSAAEGKKRSEAAAK